MRRCWYASGDVEIRPPLFPESGLMTEQKRMHRWLLRRSQQTHPGMFGCAVAFPVIAGRAGANKVLPCITSTLGFRNDMVDRHSSVRPAAILTGSVVSPNNVLLGELDIETVRDAHKNEEAYHGGNEERHAHRMDAEFRPLNHFGLPRPDHDDGPLRRAHGEWFEIIVQQQNIPFKHCRHGRVAANRLRRAITGSPVTPSHAKKTHY